MRVENTGRRCHWAINKCSFNQTGCEEDRDCKEGLFCNRRELQSAYTDHEDPYTEQEVRREQEHKEKTK